MLIKKNKFYKKCEEDILGTLRLKLKVNKVTRLLYKIEKEKKNLKGEYIFRLDKVQPKRKKARNSIYRTQLLFRKKIFLFYGDLKLKLFRRLCKVALTQRKSFEDNILYLLEGRLCMVVYRLNFAKSVREAKYIIKNGGISVNKEIKENSEFLVKEGDIIEVTEDYKEKVNKEIRERVEEKIFYTTVPKNIEVNYRVLAGIFMKKPKIDEVGYSFKLDEERFYSIYKNRIN